MTVVNDLSHLSLTDLVPSDYDVPTIVPIRTTGHLDPVFCIHPLVGLTACYADLDSTIDDAHPIYGVQAPFSGERAGSLTELAAGYVDDIAAVTTADSIQLLGLSFGGVLAHAIAVEMQRRGLTVSGLTLLDCDPVAPRGQADPDLITTVGDDIDRSRVEELLAAALHNDELSRRHLPGVFRGNVLAVSTIGSDSGAAWHPFVLGTLSKYLVPDATAFGVVGPLVDSFLG